jgi:hypothetical protein
VAGFVTATTSRSKNARVDDRTENAATKPAAERPVQSAATRSPFLPIDRAAGLLRLGPVGATVPADRHHMPCADVRVT